MPPKRKRARTSPTAFTVEFPQALDARKDGDAWWLEVDGRELRLSNLDKIFWPDEGYTKGDLIAYYFNVAHLMLPHLAGRPLTMKRMPDGIDGPFFYEKSAPSHVPDWIGRCKVLSDDAKTGVIDYMTIEDAAGLLFIANLGCIEFHPLHSRCEDVEHPDYLFFDLDPFPPYTYEDVLTVARHIKALLDQLGLTAFPKTSGATGLQIFVPIERGRYTYDQVRELVGRCGRLILQADPDRVTMAWKIADRTGKTFIDHNMNRSGANIAAAYSMRPEPRAPVSTPLTWDEVAAGRVRAAGLPHRQRVGTVRARRATCSPACCTEAADLTSAFEALGIDATAGRRRDAAADAHVRGDHRGVEGPEPGRVHPQARLRGHARAGARRRAEGQGNSFVIHKHRATRLHYDVRLEQNGALPSWAVPKGLPTAKGDKRLAVRTEDHPLEYGKFEGTIPEGHYGAGEVRIFDDGWYEPIEWDDTEGLVPAARPALPGPGVPLREDPDRTGSRSWRARRTAPLIESPRRFQPMLAEGGWKAFDDDGWWFEPKLDGIRCLAEMTTGETKLITRTGRDVTAQYPDIHMIHELVDQVNAVLDGEIVAFDAEGQELVRGAAAADEPGERARDQAGGEGDPGRARGLRRAVAGRPRDDRPDARGTARAAGADRGGGRPAPADDPRRGRREGVHRRGEGARGWKASSPRRRARSTCPASVPTRGARSSSRTRRTA